MIPSFPEWHSTFSVSSKLISSLPDKWICQPTWTNDWQNFQAIANCRSWVIVTCEGVNKKTATPPTPGRLMIWYRLKARDRSPQTASKIRWSKSINFACTRHKRVSTPVKSDSTLWSVLLVSPWIRAGTNYVNWCLVSQNGLYAPEKKIILSVFSFSAYV